MTWLTSLLKLLFGGGALAPLLVTWLDGQWTGDSLEPLLVNLGISSASALGFTLSTESVQKVIKAIHAAYMKYDESPMPNGCLATEKQIVSWIEAEVPKEVVKPRWDKLLDDVYAHFAKEREASNAT